MSNKGDLQRLPEEFGDVIEYAGDLEPRLRVKPGESFVVETKDNWFNLVKENGLQVDVEPVAASQYLRVNPLNGPIHVEGVEAGDTLVVNLEHIDVRDWGWTGTLPGFGPMDGRIGWEEVQGPWSVIIEHEPGPSGTLRDGTAVMELDRTVRWPLMPFIDTIVTAPERGSENSLVGQGPWGGNIDCREVSAGNRIFMNAGRDGGLLFMGDVHASQGDSELTALADETAAHITLSCDVIKNKSVPGVLRVEKPHSLVQVESARNAGSPERAVSNAFAFLIDWLVDDYGLSKKEAYLHMTVNSGVRAHIYQFVAGFFVCGVEFPKSSL